MNQNVRFRIIDRKTRVFGTRHDTQPAILWDESRTGVFTIGATEYFINLSLDMPDRLGNEIFDGDILKVEAENYMEAPIEFIGDVYWDRDNACFIVREWMDNVSYSPWFLQMKNDEQSSMERPLLTTTEDVEVIGNVYQNSDLIKK